MRILKYIVLMIPYLLFIYIAAYVYDSIQQVNTNERIEETKVRKGSNVKSDSTIDEISEKCGGMDSSGKYLYENYSVEFFHPSCSNYNHHCRNSRYCGTTPSKKMYECKEGIDCEMIVLITDQHNDTILRGLHNWGALDLNGETFGEVVKLQKMPADFPYLVLKDTSFGSWGQGYYYHLYSTQDKFKEIIEIGPSYKGFYKDSKGNYIIDLQHKYWPELGSNSDSITDEVSYRLTSDEEYQSTGKVFVIDMDAIKARMVSFSDKEVSRLMAYAKQSNEEIIKAFDSEIEWYLWTPDSTSEKWPLKLLRIREPDPSNGYAYGDLFNLVRNGRIDLAKQYFDILIPEQYNQFKHILPENLNSKDKLWIGYLKDLKEKSIKDLHWPVFKLLNEKHGVL